MPFYEYQCKACGAHHEAMQKISDSPLRKCPACGRSQLVRLISAPVFRLKGGGWYETDFKSDKEAKRNLADRDDRPAESGHSGVDVAKADAPKADAAKSDAKADAKPAAAKPDAGGKAGTTRASSSAAKPSRARAKPAARKAPAKKAARRR